MKKILFTILALFSLSAEGAADWLTPDGMTKVMEGTDDGTYHVSLGHNFPYYGGVFTDAWMSSNGVILLYDPTTQFGNPQFNNSMCCNGVDLSAGNPWGGFSFMLAPLWTDLRDANLTPTDGYYYQTDKGGSSFLWYNITEYGTSNTNTFQANLWPDGSFDFLYDEVDITQHNVFMGFSGDLSKNEANKLGYYQGSVTEFDIDFHSQSVNGGRAWYGQDGGYESTGPDCSNVLNDPSCPGYQEAYYDQQCSVDALYDSGCVGYAQAYLEYQCTQDDLYDPLCPGYQGALAAQDAAGTDFIFGDDISDFYEEQDTPTLDTMQSSFEDTFEEAEDFGYDESSMTGSVDETFEEVFGVEPEVAEEVFYSDPVVAEEEILVAETITAAIAEEEVFEESAQEVAMEEVFEEDIFEEDQIQEEVFVEVVEEIVDVAEEIPAEELAASPERAAGPSILSIVQRQLEADSRVNNNNKEEGSSSNGMASNSGGAFFSGGDSTFGSFDASFEQAQLDVLTDPSVVVAVVAESQEEQTIEVQLDSSTVQTDSGFQEQQNQSFSTGQSITAVLNNVQPNFSQFDVAPPSQQEQQTTQKADAQANNMSDEQLADNLDEFADELQDSGGFTDQSMTIFLMGRNSAFSQYAGQLQDNPFYIDRGMPGGRVQNDRNSMLRMIGTDNKHRELTSLQYGR